MPGELKKINLRHLHEVSLFFLFPSLTLNVVTAVYTLLRNHEHVTCPWIGYLALGYSRKNPHPHDGGHAGKSHGSGGYRLWISRREGVSEPKNTSLGVTFDFTDVSIASIDKFSKKCFLFSNFIVLFNYRPLTAFKFPSIDSSSFVEATCDNLKISRKIT